MPSQKILIVEDDKHISKLLTYNLEKAGYECLAAGDGEEALKLLDRRQTDLILLDIMLPKTDGFEVCRRLKENAKTKSVPIVMLTAKGEEVDRVVGLELGADDYIVKPFSPRELVLRIKAVLRRAGPDERKQDVITAGPIRLDIPKHRLTVGQREIELTPMEFKLLMTLMERRGLVQTREALLAEVWDIHAEVSTRTVDTHVKRLREKLGKTGALLETVTGMGYRFQEDPE